MTETSSSPTVTLSKTSLVHVTTPGSGELLGFIMNVQDQHAEAWVGPRLAFSPPRECQRHDTWRPLGPQEHAFHSEGKRPMKNQLSGRLSHPGRNRVTDVWWRLRPWSHPTPESHLSKPACCSRRLLNPQLRQKDPPSCLWTTTTGDSGLTMWT